MFHNNISYLTISDVHLGNKRNTTYDICRNLNKFFDNYTSKSKFIDLDIIFIGGDLFDKLLVFNSDDVYESISFLYRLMRFCLNNKIKLRILEGTPSHDWKQSKIANILKEHALEDLDYKYIDSLSIEYIQDLGINVLYVPDEWTDSADETYQQVLVLLKDNNLEQVDIAMMHGLFNYQLKDMPNISIKHNENNYLSIVKYFINIGHIHTFSFYDRILAQGSFDRIGHNEEESKGGIVCNIFKDGDMNYNFIENKSAKIFKTIEFKTNDLEKNRKKLNKLLVGLPLDSYIRIKAKKDNPIYSSLEEIKLQYPEYNFTKKSIEDDKEEKTILSYITEVYKPITINKDNIETTLVNQITSKHELKQIQLNLIKDIIEDTR